MNPETKTTEADLRWVEVGPELLTACKFFMGALADGDLVRDISKDGDPGWALKILKFALDLGKAQAAIVKAGRLMP